MQNTQDKFYRADICASMRVPAVMLHDLRLLRLGFSPTVLRLTAAL
jgi:hypothetical protein